MAVHADLEDEGQTLVFPEIKTQAKCPNTGSQMALPKKELLITDTVSYHLVPGKEYKLTGTLMEKESGTPLLMDGKSVASEMFFTPEEAKGSVELSFTLARDGRDRDQELSAEKERTVADTVAYQNTSETVFRAEKEEGTVEVTDNGKIIIRGNGRQAQHLTLPILTGRHRNALKCSQSR